MKTIFPLSILALAIAASPLAAQTAKPAAPPAAQKTAGNTPATAAKTAAPARGCAKLPELSPKVSALPDGLPCAKPLYTITLSPTAKLSDVSPMEDPNLRDALGIQLPSTFTLSYIDAKVGSGARVAPRKWYTIQYTGYLVDGTKFDSSYDHPDHAPSSFLQGPEARKASVRSFPEWTPASTECASAASAASSSPGSSPMAPTLTETSRQSPGSSSTLTSSARATRTPDPSLLPLQPHPLPSRQLRLRQQPRQLQPRPQLLPPLRLSRQLRLRRQPRQHRQPHQRRQPRRSLPRPNLNLTRYPMEGRGPAIAPGLRFVLSPLRSSSLRSQNLFCLRARVHPCR